MTNPSVLPETGRQLGKVLQKAI